MIHVWYLIWLWFPIPDGFERWFPCPLSPNLMCANHHMSTLSRMEGLCFPIFEPWSHFEIILKQKKWTCPQAQQSLKKNALILWCSFLVVFSKELFYWLLQYLGNRQPLSLFLIAPSVMLIHADSQPISVLFAWCSVAVIFVFKTKFRTFMEHFSVFAYSNVYLQNIHGLWVMSNCV